MIWTRLDAVLEMLSTLHPDSWAYRYWSQVRADLWRKAQRA